MLRKRVIFLISPAHYLIIMPMVIIMPKSYWAHVQHSDDGTRRQVLISKFFFLMQFSFYIQNTTKNDAEAPLSLICFGYIQNHTNHQKTISKITVRFLSLLRMTAHFSKGFTKKIICFMDIFRQINNKGRKCGHSAMHWYLHIQYNAILPALCCGATST